MDRESLRLLLSQGVSLEEIGKRFGRHPSTVSYWIRSMASGREPGEARGQGWDRLASACKPWWRREKRSPR